MAPHLARHLPGKPAVIVENMPGAGGLVAANYLAHQAKPDGLTLALMSVQAVVAQMLGDPGAAFDVRSFPPLGSPGDDIAVCLVSRASGIDLTAWRAGKARPRLGMTNFGAMSHTAASLFAEGLHLPLRPVVGYKGTSDIRMAIASGEIDGTCVGADAYLASFEPHSSYTILLQAADNDIPELADLPSASHLVSDDDGRDLLDVLNLMGTLSRFYVAPSGTPPDVTTLLREAVAETMHDELFLRDAESAHLRIRPLTPEAIERNVDRLLGLPPALHQRIATILGRRIVT